MKCSNGNCKADLSEGAKFCYVCGSEVTVVTSVKRAPCPSCNQFVQEGHNFCLNCGYKVDPALFADVICQETKEDGKKCNTVLVQGAKFCSSCGTSTKDGIKSVEHSLPGVPRDSSPIQTESSPNNDHGNSSRSSSSSPEVWEPPALDKSFTTKLEEISTKDVNIEYSQDITEKNYKQSVDQVISERPDPSINSETEGGKMGQELTENSGTAAAGDGKEDELTVNTDFAGSVDVKGKPELKVNTDTIGSEDGKVKPELKVNTDTTGSEDGKVKPELKVNTDTTGSVDEKVKPEADDDKEKPKVELEDLDSNKEMREEDLKSTDVEKGLFGISSQQNENESGNQMEVSLMETNLVSEEDFEKLDKPTTPESDPKTVHNVPDKEIANQQDAPQNSEFAQIKMKGEEQQMKFSNLHRCGIKRTYGPEFSQITGKRRKGDSTSDANYTEEENHQGKGDSEESTKRKAAENEKPNKKKKIEETDSSNSGNNNRLNVKDQFKDTEETKYGIQETGEDNTEESPNETTENDQQNGQDNRHSADTSSDKTNDAEEKSKRKKEDQPNMRITRSTTKLKQDGSQTGKDKEKKNNRTGTDRRLDVKETNQGQTKFGVFFHAILHSSIYNESCTSCVQFPYDRLGGFRSAQHEMYPVRLVL